MKPTPCVHLLEPLDLASPVDRYRAVFPERRGGFLLDGGGYSLLGAEPFLAFRAFRSDQRRGPGRGAHGAVPSALAARVVIEERGATVRAEVDDPLLVLRALLAEHAVLPDVFVDRPLPLLAGAVGYLGYETGQMLERLPCLGRPRIGMPDIAFSFHDWVLGRCLATGRSWLSVIGRGGSLAEGRIQAERTRDRIVALLTAFDRSHAIAASPEAETSGAASLTCADRLVLATRARLAVSRDSYLERIRTAKAHIQAGDAFEICLTHRIDAPFTGNPFALWQELRRKNPAPFAAYLDLPEGAVVSSSPERFLSLDASRRTESRPIKGTRARGETPAEDAHLARDLATSPKDRAENAMIVDLVRNDLGKVCRFGSVKVPELFTVERHPTVHQLVSTVQGDLADQFDAVDLLRACFPPGSMTGAPKIEAMSILERLEPTERGVYSGALGWLDFSGPLDLSVVIRTIVVKDGEAYVHVGGAIVADSDPEAEYEETMHKARALLGALATIGNPAKAGLDPRDGVAASATESPS